MFSHHFFLLKDKLILHVCIQEKNQDVCNCCVFTALLWYLQKHNFSSDKNECASPDTNKCKLVNNVVCVDTNGSYVCNCVNSSYVKSQDSVCVGM